MALWGHADLFPLSKPETKILTIVPDIPLGILTESFLGMDMCKGEIGGQHLLTQQQD